MPDPTKQTVSASQIAALFGRSPYLTEWMLYQDFIGAQPLPEPDNGRVDVGKMIEPVILQMASERLRLDVTPNGTQEYMNGGGCIGATHDASTLCPVRGYGAVEAKNVDRLQWLTGWTETAAPVHIELQLQAQMFVLCAKWGVIAALIGGNDLKIYERQPDESLHDAMREKAMAFMTRIERRDPPPMDGVTLEIPQLDELRVDEPEPEVKDMRDNQAASELVAEFTYWRDQAAFAKKNETRLKPKVLVLGVDADAIRVHGGLVQIKRKRDKVELPQLPKRLVDEIIDYLAMPVRDAMAAEILTDCMLWNTAGEDHGNVRTRLAVKPQEDGPAPWPNKWGLSTNEEKEDA